MDKIRNLKAKDIMRDIKSVTPQTSIEKLISVFEKEKVDSLAVVNKRGKFKGDIHKRDLLKLLVGPEDLSWDEVVGPFGRIVDMGYFAKNVKDLMRAHEISVSPSERLKEVIKLMFRHGLEVVPVVEKGKLIGMITELEILEQIYKNKKEFKKK